MTAPVVTADDIAAIRQEEGGLASLIAMLANRPSTSAASAPPIGSAHTSPLHRPGAWPAGTRPAGPNTCSSDCDCALDHPPLPPAA